MTRETLAVSKRQREILFLVCSGYTNQAIATHTGLTHNGVIYHVFQLSKKFGVHSRTSLAIKAIMRGIISLDAIADVYDDRPVS